MKRGVLLIVALMMLAGCSGAFTRSEFLQHDSMYKNWDHMKFSWFGYRNASEDDAQKAVDQGWWGVDVPYVPGQ